MIIDDSKNGGTVEVKAGRRLLVELGANQAGAGYWQIGDATPAVLTGTPQQFVPSTTGANCTVPGADCGIVYRSFIPQTPGTAKIVASRTACGEALACSPDQRTWTITVTITS